MLETKFQTQLISAKIYLITQNKYLNKSKQPQYLTASSQKSCEITNKIPIK